jgi:hypothetical protein
MTSTSIPPQYLTTTTQASLCLLLNPGELLPTLRIHSIRSLTPASIQAPNLSPEMLLDTYFARIHGKPYYILDEATTRQRLQANQLPGYLAYAIYAVGARYAASSKN